MADFDAIFSYGVQDDYIHTVNEIPKGSTLKIEYDRDKKVFVLDRVEPAVFAKPVNYGFIPQTTDEDGDPLDTLIITDEALPTGVALKARVIGMLDFEDDGENDHKIVCVPVDDRNTGDAINSLEDMPDQWKKQIDHHFSHYKDLKKPGSTNVRGWANGETAWRIIAECAQRYKNG